MEGRDDPFRVARRASANGGSADAAQRPEVVDEHLFIGQRREGRKPQAVENVVRKYARQAGLVDVTPHTLRHTFGKGLLDAGVDLVTVAALLGHERLETTAIRAVERLSVER